MPTVDSLRRLATAIHARMAELGMDQAGVAKAGGPSTTTLRQLDAAVDRGGELKGFQPATLRKIDTALQWEQGSARDVMAGGKPRPLPGTGELTVLREHDPAEGEILLVVPKAVLDDLSPTEAAEVRAHLVAELLARYREMRR